MPNSYPKDTNFNLLLKTIKVLLEEKCTLVMVGFGTGGQTVGPDQTAPKEAPRGAV